VLSVALFIFCLVLSKLLDKLSTLTSTKSDAEPHLWRVSTEILVWSDKVIKSSALCAAATPAATIPPTAPAAIALIGVKAFPTFVAPSPTLLNPAVALSHPLVLVS
jgi:hypothetical protein